MLKRKRLKTNEVTTSIKCLLTLIIERNEKQTKISNNILSKKKKINKITSSIFGKRFRKMVHFNVVKIENRKNEQFFGTFRKEYKHIILLERGSISFKFYEKIPT